MAAFSLARFLYSFLVLLVVLWLLFIFASRLIAAVLGRVLGASIAFRVGGWKCLQKIAVKFKKGPIESVSVGEIKVSLRQSLFEFGVGYLTGDPKLQVSISDLKIVTRSSSKSNPKPRKPKKKSKGKSGHGKWNVVANLARFLSVSINDLVIKTPKAMIELKDLLLDISNGGGGRPTVIVRLQILPIVIQLGEPRRSCDQSSGFDNDWCHFSNQSPSALLERSRASFAPFICEELHLSCEFGYEREAGICIKNVEIHIGEYQNSSGQIVLDYAKAVQESVFDQLRVVREGQLRVVFSPDLKICSWEFCARRHEELIPRRLLIPQISQLGAAAQKYQVVSQNAVPTVPELQNNCNIFLSSARQLAKVLEVPLVNDLGYTKRYVRCLQISEVVNSMKDLIDYSHKTGTGPIESMAKFPRRAGATSVGPRQSQFPNDQLQQQRHQLAASPSINGGPQSSSPQSSPMQRPATSSGAGVGNNPASTSGSSSSTIAGLLHHQNSMNSRQQNSMSNVSSPYNTMAQNQSSGSSGSIPLTQSGGNNNNNNNNVTTVQTSQSMLPKPGHVGLANSIPDGNMHMQHSELGLNDMNQSSVEKILQSITPGALQGGGSLGIDAKNRNGPSPSVMNQGPAGLGNPNGMMGKRGYSSMAGSGLGQSAMMVNGLRAAMATNSSLMNGRVSMGSMVRDGSLNHLQQQGLGNQMMNGLEPSGGFSNNLQYEWKPSP